MAVLGFPSSSSSMCGLQDWMLINPVSADHLEQQQQQPPQQTHIFHQNLGFDYNNTIQGPEASSCDDFLSAPFCQTLGAQLEKQRLEVDSFLQLQNERLRSALQQQRNHQLAVLCNSLESKAVWLMRQKEDDLARATKRAVLLQDYLNRAEMESESWQRLAKEKEAMVADLNNTLEKFKERLVLVSNSAGDAESCCGSSDDQIDHQNVQRFSKKMLCKSCKARTSSVLFLPCRHLCSCKSCEAFLATCPVCKSVKEASMEIFFV